jgi:1-phosphofructokinase/tagatose 6-phosphate kinase
VGLVGDEPDRRLYRARIDPGLVDARSGVGSGDAFLAGYVASRYTGAAPEDCLRSAVACGAESVQHFGAGVVDAAAVERLTSQVQVERLAEPALQAGG